MAPVIRSAEQEGVDWLVVDLGQHADITGQILADFGLPTRVRKLFPQQATVADYHAAIKWVARFLARLVFPGRVRAGIFGQDGIVLVHGDTLSTLLGSLLARRMHMKLALVEAGLSSGTAFSPFPEELVRRACERLAHFLFAPGPNQAARLHGKYRKVIVDTGYNTGRDALLLQTRSVAASPSMPYALVTLHRLETIRSRSRLHRAVQYVEALSQRIAVKFVLHPPTSRALASEKLFERLEQNPSVELLELQPYPRFLAMMLSAKAVFTDGGSVQEECSYIPKGCIILRDETEREHGLESTAFLTSWNAAADLEKVSGTSNEHALPAHDPMHASKLIVNTLSKADRQ